MTINFEIMQQQVADRIDKRQVSREENIKQLDNLDQKREFDWTKVEDPRRLAERARRLGFYEESGALLRDPTNKELGKVVFEQIIGANNLLEVTFLFEGARMARAVGRITLPVPGGTRMGTGFMVSSRIMMTNNHVLGDSLEAENATLELDFFKREDGSTGPAIHFRLQPTQFFVTDAPLDYSLVAVEAVNTDGVQISGRGWFPLVGPSGKAVIGERVSIIHHPNGKPQMVTVHDNKIVDVDINDDFLHYETDTMGGSSGSPVLNIDWDLVALHHAAVGKKNEGIRVSSIVAHLKDIFENGSTGTPPDVDDELLDELMAAVPPPQESLPHPIAPAPTFTGDGPRLNTNGTASWTLPINLTIGVGTISNQVRTVTVGIPPEPSVGPSVQVPPVDDAALSSAIQALEDTAGQVYYSAVKDKQAVKGYYPDLEALTGKQLYDTLSALVADTHTNTLSYDTARLTHLYPWIDRREGSTRDLRGIYSNKVFDALEVIRQEVHMEQMRQQAIQERMRVESAGAMDRAFLEELEFTHPFNCEHVVPQSWFNYKKQPKTDLHHLFTCEWGCNSFRGNRAYFDFQAEAFRDNCGENEENKFEPRYGKGAVARATLYFLLRYPGEMMDSGEEMPKDRLQTIIKWAQNDKVDRWERHRNAEIHKVQGNRNPLIDFPELVDKIDFEVGWA